jgi:phage-related protein
LKTVGKYANITGAVWHDEAFTPGLVDKGRPEGFPGVSRGNQLLCLGALTVAAEGGKSDIAKPMRGFGSGVFEIALAHRGDAFRVVYAVQLDDVLWVVHAFQKKSTRGVKTPKREIDLIADRIKRLEQTLKESGR